jgi:anti-anti-sigma factor
MSTTPDGAGNGAAPRGAIAPGEDGTGALLRFSGVIDREAVRRFRRLAPPSSWPARADLADVATIDSAGLELLVHLARKPRRHGGELELLAVPRSLYPVFARAGLSRLLPRPGESPTGV